VCIDASGTLYDAGNGYVQNNRQNIFRLMIEKGFAANAEEAEAIWRPLFQEHNQSYKALRVGGGFDIDKDEFWSTHRKGVEKFLFRDEPLSQFLQELPFKKYIFTNARETEAFEALAALGIRDCFEDKIYGADFLGDICKPQAEAFSNVLNDIGVSPSNCVFFEDSVKNLIAGKMLGMSTVLVQGFTSQEEGEIEPGTFDAVVSTLTDGGEELRLRFPALFTLE